VWNAVIAKKNVDAGLNALAERFRARGGVTTLWREDEHLLELVEIPFDASAPDRGAEATRLTAACTVALEAAIRRHPTEWVWMHERWKTQPSANALAKPVPKSVELTRA
jgi:lauroyl/myristoyl acyltransferase